MRVSRKTLYDHIQDRMLIAATVSLAAGGGLAVSLSLPAAVLALLLPVVLFLLGLTLFYRKRPEARVLLVCTFLAAGLVHTGYALLPPSDSDHLYTLIQDRTRVSLTGTVISMPEYDGRKTRFLLDADSVLIHDAAVKEILPRPAHGRVQLSLESPLPGGITAGSRLLLLATVSRIFNYRTPGVFDYRLHMAANNVNLSGRIDSATGILPFTDLSSRPFSDLRFVPEQIRQHIGSFLDTALAPSAAGMYKALLIGSRAGVPDQVIEQYKATGCMHLLAISGLHMSLLGLGLFFLFTWLLKRSEYLLLHTHVPTLATLLTLAPLIGYAFIAGLNTPVLRALIMSTLFLLAVVLRRQRSILPIVAAAALILLLLRPLLLFTVSFQLSFASVLAIGVIYPKLSGLWEEQNPSSNRIIRFASTALLVSVAATLGSLPFMLYHFNRVSLIGPVWNLLVEPLLCFWTLPLGLLATPFIFLAPDLASVLLQTGSAGIIAADRITAFGSSLPFASVWTVTPDIVSICIYYLLLGLLLLPASPLRIRIAALAAQAALACYFLHGLWFSFPGTETRVSYLDVGQGSSTLIRLPDGTTLLIDGGSKTMPAFDIGERVIGPYLWKNKIWRLDDIVITHPDTDHYNGLDFILRRFRPKRLWINGDGTDTPPFSDLLRTARETGVEITEPSSGQFLQHSRLVRTTFVKGAHRPNSSPDGQQLPPLSVNDRSLVLRLTHETVSFLFPGDISHTGEQILLQAGKDIRATVLLAPHHGSRGSNSKPFIAAVDPEIIVVSSGSGSQGRYLDREHVHDWRVEGRTVLATAMEGTVELTTDGKSVTHK